jgi:DNA-binding MarR family transcriptional regulator
MLELARYLNLEKSSVSGLVDRAAQRGLVQRSPGTKDGRAVHVSITPAGRAIADQSNLHSRSSSRIYSLTFPRASAPN